MMRVQHRRLAQLGQERAAADKSLRTPADALAQLTV